MQRVGRSVFKAFKAEAAVTSALTRGRTLSVAASVEPSDVPAGHKNSDLNAHACNIGLNRRRDLMLRQDLRLYTSERDYKLSELLKGKLSVLFGVPDMGKVCSQQHAPSYISKAAELKKRGVEQVFCVAVAEPEAVEEWAAGLKLPESQIQTLADKNGSFAKLLGVDLEPVGAPGPKCQRYAALIEDGILLKLTVDDSPGDMDKSSADTILGILKHLQSLDA